MTTYHTPVLREEVLTALNLKPGQTILDGTLGGGGHARAILERIGPTGTVIGFDQDASAIQEVTTTLGRDYPQQLIVIHANVRQWRDYVTQQPVLQHVTGALLDLGISAHQLIEPGRGFSFNAVADPLDMRMDQRQSITAAAIANTWSLNQLTNLLRNYGEEPRARSIAQAIVQQRELQPLATVGDLLKAIGPKSGRGYPPARTFQAFRIAVNDELGLLPQLLTDIISLLTPGSRFAVITFHSLEDRIVKQTFAFAAKGCICPPTAPACVCDHVPSIKLITKKPICPSDNEITHNSKARSAKLRVIEIITHD